MNTFGLLRPFLTALRAQIVNDGVFPADNVQLSLFDDDNLDRQFPQGSPILEIIPQGFASVGWDAGGGIQDLTIKGEIQCKIIIMNVLDTIQTDVTVLTSTDQTLGVLELNDQLIAELEMLALCDESGNSFLIEPMRFLRFSKPTRPEKHAEWVIINQWYECRICQAIQTVS